MSSIADKYINIVIIIPTLKGAGAERVMLTLATHLRNQGVKVSIVVFDHVVEIESDFHDIYHFQQYYRWIPRKIRGICVSALLDRFIAKNCGAPDIVLSNLLIVDKVVVHSRYNKHIVVHSTMSAESKNMDIGIEEYVSLYKDQSLICVSEGVMSDAIELLGNKSPDKVRYIYNPVDTVLINKLANITANKLSRNSYIVHVGSFSPPKRHDLLIRAYAKSCIEERLVLVGKGKLENDIKNLVAELAIEEKVIFAGFQSNPYPIIKNARLMVLSSDYEGLPTVILEAMSLGVPVVSTNCKSGPSEMLPAKNLCTVGDATSLATLIIKGIASPSEYVAPLRKEFTPEFVCGEYVKLAK